MEVARATAADLDGWAGLRARLWPDDDTAHHRAEAAAMLGADDAVAFVAHGNGAMVGFVEAAVRHEYVNGCDDRPAGFVEGLYVDPTWRGRGMARALISAVEAWAGERGLVELASDAPLDNDASHAFHRAAGFEETERVVFFRKLLTRGDAR